MRCTGKRWRLAATATLGASGGGKANWGLTLELRTSAVVQIATVQTARLAPMSIWRASITPEALTERGSRSLPGYLGIRITEIRPDFLPPTLQPFGVLHGGASVALAETVGSLASMMCVDTQQSMCLGQEINANHLRAVSTGTVTATARPLPLGGGRA